MEENEIREDEEQVAEEATPETPDEAVEQRTDDYDGLARRLDDVLAGIDAVLSAVERVESAVGVFVESGATVREGMDEISEEVIEDTGINDIIDDSIEEVVSIDELDLS